MMTNVELFKASNFKFFSIHKGVAGSLYFKGVENRGAANQVVYCGRIRLCHKYGGPTIENNAVSSWLLLKASGSEVDAILNALDKGNDTGNYQDYIVLVNKLKQFADIVKGDSLIPAMSRDIFERHLYLNGTEDVHPSRGVLESKDAQHQISDEQLKAIIDVITTSGGDIKTRNKRLKACIDKGMPSWLRQPESEI